MRFQTLEFDKYINTDIEFSDRLQQLLNENNDLMMFKASERPSNQKVSLEFVFGTEKTFHYEAFVFGPNDPREVEEMINAVVITGHEQGKTPLHVGLVHASKTPRAVGILILQKALERKGIAGEQKENEAKARKQNSQADAKPNKRSKRN